MALNDAVILLNIRVKNWLSIHDEVLSNGNSLTSIAKDDHNLQWPVVESQWFLKVLNLCELNFAKSRQSEWYARQNDWTIMACKKSSMFDVLFVISCL